MAIDKALYTAHATSTGGRAGGTESSDGKIKLQLSTPKGLGGDDGPGTNPEQLFAAAHEVCPYSNATRGNVDVALSVA